MRTRMARGCASTVLAFVGCGFERGGIPGPTDSASIGTAEDDGTATTDDEPSDGGPTPGGADPEPGPTTADPTTASNDAPTSTSTSDATATTGEPDPTTPLDTGSSTTIEGDAESSSDDGNLPVQPFYGDCTGDADCGDGVCAYFELQRDPDAAVCVLPCDEGMCPEPPDGQAETVCTMSGCALDCGVDEEGCPTGMECYILTTQDGSFARCLWTQQ